MNENLKMYFEIDENEKPLEKSVINGGLCSILMSMGCIGDSLSSGEFEKLYPDGNHSYHDMTEFSWGQHIANDAGITVYNMSHGGQSAKFLLSEIDNYYGEKFKAKSYIIALGVNDLFGFSQKTGTTADIEDEKSETFAHYYGTVIKKYKELEPNARFFLVSMPKEYDDDARKRKAKEEHSQLLKEMCSYFKHTYIIDLFEYAPLYTKEFKEKYFMLGHMNPQGYRVTSYMIESYIDYIIRHNPEDFQQMGFIGTNLYDPKLDK